MTDTDYNRRMATALGVDHDACDCRKLQTMRILGCAWARCCQCGAEFVNEGDTQGKHDRPLHDYATDWTQLPAILAALFACDIIDVYRLNIQLYATGAYIGVDGDDDSALGANLLLAAGALLLKLAEGKS